jgi:phosphate transport system substrate-binding protein
MGYKASTLVFVILLFSQGLRAEEKILLSCANSSRESLIDKASAAFTKETEVKIVMLESGRRTTTASYFKDLLEGKADAACASIAYNDWLGVLKQESVAIPPDFSVTSRVLGKDLIFVLSNKGSGVTNLSMIQLVSIFSGEVKNWKLVGGNDVPISIFVTKAKINVRQSFAKILMSHKPFSSDVIETKSIDDLLMKVASVPGGVTIFAEPVTSEQIVTVKTPDIGRPITLITKGRPSSLVEKYIAFVRKISGTN